MPKSRESWIGYRLLGLDWSRCQWQRKPTSSRCDITIASTGAGGRAGFKWRVIAAGPVMRDVRRTMLICTAMSKHRWQLNLRLFLLLCACLWGLLLCACLWVVGDFVGVWWRRQQAHDAAVARIFDAGGLVRGDDGVVDYSWTQASDNDLVHLENLNGLREVYLHGPGFTDSGLSHLESLTSLQQVVLIGTRVSPTGIRKLKQSLPSCKIRLISPAGIEIDDWEWLQEDEN